MICGLLIANLWMESNGYSGELSIALPCAIRTFALFNQLKKEWLNIKKGEW